jgi:hypothetical protein
MMDPVTIEACARAAHEVNRAYCRALGDESQVSWDDAPDWQRQSAIKGVEGVLIHGNGPAASHASWLAEKKADGWRWGPMKDLLSKEHPCMLPYEELPHEQQQKDMLFVKTVTAMALALTR